MQKRIILVLLFISTGIIFNQKSNAAVYFHLLHGFEGGYKFSMINSSNLDNMIEKYNNYELRQNWCDDGYKYMDYFNLMNGFYIRYNLYKYLDKRDKPLSSYQFSGEFTRSYGTSESYFDYQFETAYRNFNYMHSSLMVNFTYGFSFSKNLLTYLELGVGFDTFSIESELIAPSNFNHQDVLDFENEHFTSNTDSTQIQNGTFAGSGYSIKLEMKNEYFITNSFTIDLGLGMKFMDIGELWKDDNKNLFFRKSQDENEEFLYSAFEFSIKLGLGYYFILQ